MLLERDSRDIAILVWCYETKKYSCATIKNHYNLTTVPALLGRYGQFSTSPQFAFLMKLLYIVVTLLCYFG